GAKPLLTELAGFRFHCQFSRGAEREWKAQGPERRRFRIKCDPGVLAAILGGGMLAAVNACSSAQPSEAQKLESASAAKAPESLKVPDGQKLLLHTTARGFQIYVRSEE